MTVNERINLKTLNKPCVQFLSGYYYINAQVGSNLSPPPQLIHSGSNNLDLLVRRSAANQMQCSPSIHPTNRPDEYYLRNYERFIRFMKRMKYVMHAHAFSVSR